MTPPAPPAVRPGPDPTALRLHDAGPPPTEGGPVTFAVVGSGWRSGYYLRVARMVPDRFRATTVVSRTADRGAEVTARWGVPTVRTVRELLDAGRPEVVVVSTPWDVTPGVITELVVAGVPVLVETPPAPDVAGLRRLWAEVGGSGLVQVAEHSPFLPAQAARLEVLRSGAVGRVTQVQVSSTQQYHAMALIRAMLEVGGDPVTVTARRVTAPLMDPVVRTGWTDATTPQPVESTLALLDLGDGRSAVYDYTANQARNPLRPDRLLVRGSHGELSGDVSGDVVTRWVDPRTVVSAPVVRRQIGVEQGMDGFDLEHLSYEGRVIYRNPYVGARMSDDDIAVATLLDRTGAWVRGAGEPPYPLSAAAQDHLLGRAVEEAADTGRTVTTGWETWAR